MTGVGWLEGVGGPAPVGWYVCKLSLHKQAMDRLSKAKAY